ncbi:MAG: DUF4245 family protein [Brachybacterium sp.]|nr:DUF4245 family protein [Brachybacterium sp.]
MRDTPPDRDAAPAPPKRSHYAVSKSSLRARNVAWALGLTIGVVVLVAVLFFGVGGSPEEEMIPQDTAVDVQQSADRASEVLPFPAVVPEPGESWSVREVRLADGEAPRWQIRYTSPDGNLVTLVQTAEVTPGVLQDVAPGVRADGTAEVDGVTCEALATDESGSDAPLRALSCPGDGWALVVTGRADQQEIEELAAAAFSSVTTSDSD